MKKNYLMMMAMLLFAAISFTGCSDDDDKDVITDDKDVTTDVNFETLLVGTWEQIHSTGYEIVNGITDSWDEDYGELEEEAVYFTIYSNGTANDEDGDTFTWKVTGNTLTLWEVTYDEDTLTDEENYTILTLTETKLVLYAYEEDEDGYIYSETITFRKC